MIELPSNRQQLLNAGCTLLGPQPPSSSVYAGILFYKEPVDTNEKHYLSLYIYVYVITST